MKIRTLLAASALLFFSCSCACAQTEKIMISQIQGNPMIVREGLEIAAAPGMAARTNDVFKTLTAECTVDLALNDKAGCRILGSSEVVVSSAKERLMHLKLNNGNVILNIDKLSEGSEFKVETPTAIAAVRGTQFWGRANLSNPTNAMTTFAVREGTVEIFSKNTGRSFILNERQALDIPQNVTALPSIRPALAEELAAMEQASAIRTSA